MPADDEDGCATGEPGVRGDPIVRDPALRAELELIMPALAPPARRAFRQALAAAGPAGPSAAVVLEALVAASRASEGRGHRGRA